MFVCVFIDWENIEKGAKYEFGSVLDYEEFVKVIREAATSNGAKLVGIQAYGDFDRGTAGLKKAGTFCSYPQMHKMVVFN